MYFSNQKIVESKDINDNVLIELDEKGNVVSMTLEHAKDFTEVFDFSFQQIVSN
ncbi:MAG TPA: DUF2283 domain-containing protein [Candidatus Kapabacteria bacterium]|nr:DUF2283 domain-containing protein [Candidatus Kapabacteria bacterium]